MLSITFKKNENTVLNVDGVFNNNYEDCWLEDDLVKQIVLDIDKSIVVNSHVIESPILGQITPRELAGGTKALIMMLKTDWEIWATSCGDNCAKWILKIAEIKDITISLTHLMHFPVKNFEFYNVDTGEMQNDIVDAWLSRERDY